MRGSHHLRRGAKFFCAGWIAILLGEASFAATAPATAAPLEVANAEVSTPITTVAGAFVRWPDLTNDEGPVRLEGVVTGTMPSGAFRLHDGELGIYVSRSPAGQKLVPGDRVAVSGVLRQGGFSPWIAPHEVTPLGRGEFPPARPVAYHVLASGEADNQWVEIEGVVRAVQVPEQRGLVVLDLGMAGGQLRVLVNSDTPAEFQPLIDAAVVIRGVAAVNVNAQKHVVEPSFRVPSFSEITVTRPGKPDAFAQPLVPLERLMKFSLGASHLHRVRTSGVVTRRLSDTTLFVRAGAHSLKIESNGPHAFQAGEKVEAAGFPVMVDGMAVLQQAICRSLGKTAPPRPVEPTLANLLEGTHNSDLVSIQARFIDWAMVGQSVTLVFQSGDHLFKTLLNLPSSRALRLPEKDSVVKVTGICVINEVEDMWFYQPRSFLLLLADLDDLTVLQAPPWWTQERLWRALIITGTVLLAAGAWVWALRRQIGRKRSVIEQQTRHAAVLEERGRIARELHDTLEQGLTGLSLQMKAMETDLAGAPPRAHARLQSARQMLRQSRALARHAIRELRTEAVPSRLEGLVDGLKRVARAWNQSGVLAVSVEIVGQPRPLPLPIEPHLLGIGTEAMTNAVKHGRASAIHVEVSFHPAQVTLRIRDDGVGFETPPQLEQASGCFGLLGMHERAREIRGELRIQSVRGHGTEVIVTAPVAVEPVTPEAQVESVRPAETLPVRAPAT